MMEAADCRAKIVSLLRLADRGSNGFPDERQLALDKALAIARDNGIRIENILMTQGLDVSDLRRSGPLGDHEASTPTTPPSREDCSGIYPIAGFRHYDGPANRHRMRVGDPVTLLRVSGNPHDAHAVFVTWNGLDLGHLPRGRNKAIWRFLRARSPLDASIADIDPAPHGTVEIEIR